MDKAFKAFAEDGAKVETHIEFTSTKHLTSLPEFHFNGGELKDGMVLLAERNARTQLKEVILHYWSIGTAKFDLTGMGKYAESTAYVFMNGSLISWPFSMLYIKPEGK